MPNEALKAAFLVPTGDVKKKKEIYSVNKEKKKAQNQKQTKETSKKKKKTRKNQTWD